MLLFIRPASPNADLNVFRRVMVLISVRLSAFRMILLQGGTKMSLISRWRWRSRAMLALTLSLVFVLSTTLLAYAGGGLKQISNDPFTNKTSQHMTELEPDTFAFGNTIVSAFQVGRFYNGGASDIGWATSTDGGATFTHGFLPGITVFKGGGPYGRARDASVAF